MTRDYVRKSGAKKPTPKKRVVQKPTPKNKNVSNNKKLRFITIITLILIIAFAYGLYSMSRAKKKEIKVLNPKHQVKDDFKLPPKPEEKWNYRSELAKKTVDVTPNNIKSKLHILCGTFKDIDAANSRKAELGLQGLSSEVQTIKAKVNSYNVLLGPYSTKEDAVKILKMTHDANLKECKIISI